MKLQLQLDNCTPFIDPDQWQAEQRRAATLCTQLLEDETQDKGSKGWVQVDKAAVQLDLIRKTAADIRAKADVFVLVGVGGSNQAARAMIEALQEDGPEILYAGNTLSPYEIARTVKLLEGKSVYINVIAKNFETLEPGSHFRILRQALRSRYSADELARRIVLTGTPGSRLEEIAEEQGHTFLHFPEEIGGRYSAFSPVGLLPMAVAGLDVDAYLHGGREMEQTLRQHPGDNIAIRYAAMRSCLYGKGFDIEVLASFEPRFARLAKWWWQLYGESEGKDGKGIFPAFATYSEDLHSLGQYMQQGRRNLLQTVLSVADPGASVVVQPDTTFDDGFDFLNGKDFAQINRAAQQATLEAHVAGGVPCMVINIPKIDAEAFGSLFYFFMAACAVSAGLLGVNAFDQPGVEDYKGSMFQVLGK